MQLSRIAFFCCAALILFTGMYYYPKWNKSGSEATISWDVSGYYMYLPAAFIYKDLKKCAFKDSILTKYQPTPDFQQAFLHSSGNYVMKYSSGQALMMLPFFFSGHAAAKASSSYSADGFSYPYQLAIGLGMLIYAFIGLWFLRKTLLNYFSDAVTAVTLVIVVVASNYLNYASIDGAMTHNTLFTLYCLLLYMAIRFNQQPAFFKALIIGCLCGLATLIRPTEIISVLIPVLWGLQSLKELKNRVSKNLKYYVVMALGFSVLVSVQPLYWKWATGEWVVYSYQEQGFNFLQPYLWKGLFDFRNGWLIYSPVFILVFPGFYFLYKQHRNIFFCLILFSILFIYICFSWKQWWYGGSLGARAMVQAYPVLAFSIAACIQYIGSQKEWIRIGFAAWLGLCMYYNLWLTHQAHKGGLYKAGEMTCAYWKTVVFKQQVNRKWDYLLDNDEMYKGYPQKTTTVYENNFENDTSSQLTTTDTINGKSLFLNKADQYTAEYKFKPVIKDKKWIRASADFKLNQKEWEPWRMTQFCIRFYNKGKLIKHRFIRVHRLLNDNETRNLFIDIKTPSADFDEVGIYWWNPGNNQLLIIDNLKVVAFDR